MRFLLNARRLFLVVCAIVFLGVPAGSVRAATVFRTIDDTGDVGWHTSLELTASCNPFIGYLTK